MKKVLIVSPRFPPTSAADHQRVRMMLPLLRTNGWDPTVLAVDPAFVEAPLETDLLRTIPEDIPVIRCKAIPQSITRRLRFGSLTFRSYGTIRDAGDAILANETFDLVFFSTTEFGIIPLGARWKKKFGVPFVVDLQDPWVNTYYDDTGAAPPGGRLKHSLTQLVARWQEGPSISEAAGIISVSSLYPVQLIERSPDARKVPSVVIPFAGSRADFQAAADLPPNGRFVLPDDGRMHWVYAGTAPPGIKASVIPFLLALRSAFGDGLLAKDSLRCHFIGTDYAPSSEARPRVVPIAEELGMRDAVVEYPARIGYLETLRCLRSAHALMVFGWDDPGYTASKVYPYILAERPLISVLHEKSSAASVVERTNAGVSVTFGSEPSPANVAAEITSRWFRDKSFDRVPDTRWDLFDEFTAETMTARASAFFDSVT